MVNSINTRRTHGVFNLALPLSKSPFIGVRFDF